MRKTYVLIGNYGNGNLGDEALREYFASVDFGVDWRVVSARPATPSELYRLPCGARSLFAPWWRTAVAIARSQGIVYGGGTLFTDIESVTACMMWWTYAFVAWCCRRKILLAFQGVGPFRTWTGAWLTRWIFERATFISVRDEESLRRILPWHLLTNPLLTFDPALVRFSEVRKRAQTRRSLIIIPRMNASESFRVAALEQWNESRYDEVRILLMQPDAERGIAESLQSRFSVATIVAPSSVTQFLDEVAAATHVVTQRYHGAIAAIAVGVPLTIAPQREGDKLSALAGFAGTRAAFLELILASQHSLIVALRR